MYPLSYNTIVHILSKIVVWLKFQILHKYLFTYVNRVMFYFSCSIQILSFNIEGNFAISFNSHTELRSEKPNTEKWGFFRTDSLRSIPDNSKLFLCFPNSSSNITISWMFPNYLSQIFLDCLCLFVVNCLFQITSNWLLYLKWS